MLPKRLRVGGCVDDKNARARAAKPRPIAIGILEKLTGNPFCIWRDVRCSTIPCCRRTSGPDRLICPIDMQRRISPLQSTAKRRVEVRKRLVHQENARLHRQRSCEAATRCCSPPESSPGLAFK